MAFMEAISVLGSFAPYVIIAVQTFGAAFDIYQSAKDDTASTTEKTMRIGANLLFIGFQTTAIGATGYDAQPAIKLGLGAAAAGSDIMRTGIKLGFQKQVYVDDYIQFVGTALFRVSCVSQQGCTLMPVMVGGNLDAARKAVDVANGIGIAGMNAKKIYQVGAEIGDGFKTLYIISQMKETFPEEVKVHIDQADRLIIEANRKYAEQMRKLQATKNISEWSQVPKEFERYPTLRQYICPITKKPIRFPLTVVSKRPIHYESQALQEHFARNTSPPAWPPDVQFDSSHVAALPAVAKIIDNTLQTLLTDIQKVDFKNLDEDENDCFFAIKGQEIGVDNFAISDGELTDKLLTLMPKNKIATLEVRTEKHHFEKDEDPMWVRKIVAHPKIFIGKSPILPEGVKMDGKAALRALFGSQSINDQEALDKAYKARTLLTLYLAMDLTRFEIS